AELQEKRGESTDPGEGWHGLLYVVGGIAIMASGGWLAVIGAERLVEALAVTDSVIGLSLIALATTAELFALAASAHRHGVGELAVAGVVGSAGYNATVTLGGAALARPIATGGVAAAGWLAAGLPVVVLALGGRQGYLRRAGGAVLVAVYVVYLAVLYV
ncbi:MAG: sodium:calcium antiporter, partial [Acidimicrobiia bacterium]